jgi:hypothetical protein
VWEDTHRGDLGVLPVPAGRVVVGHQTTHGGSSVVGRQSHRAGAECESSHGVSCFFHDGTAFVWTADFFITSVDSRICD